MATKAAIPFLVTMMLLTGVCNTLLTKYQVRTLGELPAIQGFKDPTFVRARVRLRAPCMTTLSGLEVLSALLYTTCYRTWQLTTKSQDMQCVHNCSAPNRRNRVYFEQPVIQTLQMFIGEVSSWLVIGGHSLYKRYAAQRKQRKAHRRLRNGRGPTAEDPLLADNNTDDTLDGDDEDYEEPHSLMASTLLPTGEDRAKMSGSRLLLLALPACCDIAGTTLMNVGLLFVAASIYQMTRGALVLFVGLFSVIFLKRHLALYKWFSLFVVVLGVAIVGLAGAIAKDTKAVPSTLQELVRRALDRDENGDIPSAVRTVIGVLLIAAAQIFTATQFVLEENIMEKYALEPLKAVGWEGIWGLLVTTVGMIVLHFAYGQTPAGRGGYFDAREGLWQMTHFRSIGLSSILIMISIG